MPNIQKALGEDKFLACFGAKRQQQVVIAIFACFLRVVLFFCALTL
jgi:hypothetical protein